jgi:hypothetical protein
MADFWLYFRDTYWFEFIGLKLKGHLSQDESLCESLPYLIIMIFACDTELRIFQLMACEKDMNFGNQLGDDTDLMPVICTNSYIRTKTTNSLVYRKWEIWTD